MKQMLIVIKETYLRQVKSWSFFLMVLFSLSLHWIDDWNKLLRWLFYLC